IAVAEFFFFLTTGYCSSALCSRDLILVHDQPKTWSEGQTYCKENYADLVTISNAQDMNKVIDIMNEDVDNFWIGLYEDVLTWSWSLSDVGYYGDGEAEFRNWDAGEPNSQSGIQHCAGMQHTGKWKDLDCGLLNFFLCLDGNLVEKYYSYWAEAQHYCRQSHKDLVSVRNQAENQEVQSMVPAGKLAWIGLFGDSWKWSDGRNSLIRYWGQGQLDNLGEGPNSHSEHANLTQIVKYFCPTSIISKLLPEASQQYHLITGSLTWHEARSFCRVKYTDLAAVNNMADKNRLVNMLGGRVAHTWIGLHKGAADRWMWSDGSGRVHFTRWKEGEPNNVAGDEWCGEMSEAETWNDMSCGDKKSFVCYERELMTHRKVIKEM
uniref:C-type lectin domain-containing protein n=1 Tax=Seriola dumerili TaxID=41447 RepID=A0A3B4UQ52_SERDU